jgi:hypothetical protein
VAKALREERSLQREIPDAVVPVSCFYFVPEKSMGVLRRWRAGGVQYREVNPNGTPLSPSLQRKHCIRAFQLGDRVIDRALTQAHVESKVHQGAKLICGAEVIACRQKGNQITHIIAQTPSGSYAFATDFVVSVAGAYLAKVAERLNAGSKLGDYLELAATAVLRAPSFVGEPMLLQFFGDLLEHLSVIPIGRTRRLSIATRGGQGPIADPDHVNNDLELERQRLLRLLAEGFDLLDLPEPQTISWCVKGHLTHPAARSVRAGSRLVTVIPGQLVNDAANLLHTSPGKLGNCLALRDYVVVEVNRYFALEAKSVA